MQLQKRTQAGDHGDGTRLRRRHFSTEPSLPSPAFSHERSKRRRQCSECCMLLAVGCAALTLLFITMITMWFAASFIFPEEIGALMHSAVDAVMPIIQPRLPSVAAVPIRPSLFVRGSPVPLILPLVAKLTHLLKPEELLRELLGPLLQSEAALCHRADDGAAVVASVQAVVVSRVPATAVAAAVGGVVAGGDDARGGAAVADGGAGGELTAGSRWRAWELSTVAVRSALGLPAAGADAGWHCLGDVVTVVGEVGKGTSGIVSGDGVGEEARDTLEVLVDAGLRTRGGSAGSHFVVLASFLGASRMAYTEPGDAAETRHEGTGLIDALLRTATRRNGGRVAAAQCTMLQQRSVSEMLLKSNPSTYPPDALSRQDLRALQVVDKGGFTGSSFVLEYLAPFMSRRLSGYAGLDQRTSWEEVVDAASLHCGVFHRELYNATGGLAAVRADSAVAAAERVLRGGGGGGEKTRVHAVAAPDRGGWLLSLRMQEQYPEWQVWSSRAVAVVRDDDANVRRVSGVVGMQSTVLSLLDEYGQSVYLTVSRLQRRRVGVPWMQRGLPGTALNFTLEEEKRLPAIMQYYTDFTEPCCGLNREAMSYVRPLMDRYPVRVFGTSKVCRKPGDALLAVPYSQLDALWMPPRFSTAETFFRQRLHLRARVNFQHWRAFHYPWRLTSNASQVPLVSIGRSLSELSNIPRSWKLPMQERTDEVWATADFFATIYRRNGVDPAKIRVVPEAVDVYEYDPANYERQVMEVLPGQPHSLDTMPNMTVEERRQRYVFFSNFKWEDRKGWDVLLGAYWDAFGPNAPPEMRNRTTLVIKTKFEAAFTRGVSSENLVVFIEKWGRLGPLKGLHGAADLPHIIFLADSMTTQQIAQLYANADAFVFPSKAEGWGLPATEAMSMGLPVLITEWGGLRRFITPDTCFRIPLDGLAEIAPDSPYGYGEGFKMAVPSREKTAELMRYVVENPEHARRVGRRARALIVREMSEEAVADVMDHVFTDALRHKMRL